MTTAFVLVGRHFDLHLAVGPLIGITGGVVLLGVDFGLLALLVGVASGSRGLALGLTSALAAASYVLSSLAPVVGWIRPLRFVIAVLLQRG